MLKNLGVGQRYDETQIVQLMRTGDRQYIGMLYDMYGDRLYGLALRIARDESLASDIVQESFVKVWKKGRSFDASRSKVYTWLFSIVRNTAIDKVRSRKVIADREIQMDQSNVSDIEAQGMNPDVVDLPVHLQRLESKYREVIETMFFKGFTQQETSEKLDIPLGTVKTRLRIGLRELRKVYHEEAPEGNRSR